MALGQRQRELRALYLAAYLEQLLFMLLYRSHKSLPGRSGIFGVLGVIQWGSRVEEMMKGHVVDRFTGALDHLRRPAAIAPADELDRRIDLPHRLAELER